MLSEKIIRAWKDVAYRLSLSEAERDQLPEHSATLVELTAEDLSQAVGGFNLVPPEPAHPPQPIHPPEPL
jgi:mersacidin/lichenicidin family type 2 lantibiotic